MKIEIVMKENKIILEAESMSALKHLFQTMACTINWLQPYIDFKSLFPEDKEKDA